jgi:hypothetical protein
MSKGKEFANDLARMSAPARLELALARLMQTERLVHEVICLAEQRRAFLRNFHMLDWQQNRAFETLLITIFYFEIIQIAASGIHRRRRVIAFRCSPPSVMIRGCSP